MADKRIKDLTNTATSSTLSADQYAVVDGSTGTFKTKLSELATWIHGRWASFVNALTGKTSFASGDKIAVVNGSTATAMGKDYLLQEMTQEVAKCREFVELDEFVRNNLTIVDKDGDVNLYNEWESGYFVSGVPTASQYAWRTKNFYDCTEIDGVANSVLVHLADSDYKFAIVVYDENGIYSATSQLQAANFNPGVYGEHRKYKIYITRADNQKITFLTDAQANAICYVEKKDVAVEANVDGANELKAEIEAEIDLQTDVKIANAISGLTIMDGKEDINLFNEWESGYFVSGVPTASQYGWRTKNFYDCTDIDFVNNSAIVHIDDAAYKFVLVIYDGDGNYVNTTSTGGTTTDLTPTSFGTNRKYKIYIMRVDGTKITSLSDDAANAICYIEKTGVEVPANVGGADELLGIVDEKIAIAGGSGVVEPFTISKIAFIGDSFTMLDVYTKKVVELFGLTNSDYRNYGISGYGVMDFVEQNKKSWIGGMADCQVATFWLGTNDFAQERPLGDLDSAVTTDFTGCLRELLSWWCSTSSFDNQLKLVITPCQRWGFNSDPIPNPTMTNGLGLTLKDYSDRIKDVAHDYGIAVLDFYEESGIDKENAARTTRDGLHPTDTYFNRLGIRIAKAIKNKCV